MTKIYEIYSKESDITFILEDTFLNGELLTTELKGFYYGEPTKFDTQVFYGQLKADYKNL
jgi:hypothetical protein